MSHRVTIRNRQRARAVGLPRLRRIARALVAELPQIKHADLGIVLVTASEIARLNETFLHHAGVTDVITFDYSVPLNCGSGRESTSTSSKVKRNVPASAAAEFTTRALHGEIFICVDEAIRQARHFHTTWKSELVRYVIHGVLHLYGYDDQRATDRRRMKREENRFHRFLIKQCPLT